MRDFQRFPILGTNQRANYISMMANQQDPLKSLQPQDTAEYLKPMESQTMAIDKLQGMRGLGNNNTVQNGSESINNWNQNQITSASNLAATNYQKYTDAILNPPMPTQLGGINWDKLNFSDYDSLQALLEKYRNGISSKNTPTPLFQ